MLPVKRQVSCKYPKTMNEKNGKPIKPLTSRKLAGAVKVTKWYENSTQESLSVSVYQRTSQIAVVQFSVNNV